jgi:hypothetical protein
MVAAKIAKLVEGRPTKTARNQAVSQPEAAKALKVGRSSVQAAAKVIASGDKKLIADVEAGKVKVSQAARVPRAVAAQEAYADQGRLSEGAKPAPTSPAPATAPRRPKAPNPYEDVALQFSNAINRIEEIAARLDAAKLRSVFPGELVKNLDISLEKASEFLAAMWAAHAATKKNAADGPAAPLNLH